MSEKKMLGKELITIYGIKDDAGDYIGLAVGSSLKTSESIIKILERAVEQMRRNKDKPPDFEYNDIEGNPIETTPARKEVKLELKGGLHTKIIVWEQDGKINAFPIENFELALKEGTEETLKRIKGMGL